MDKKKNRFVCEKFFFHSNHRCNVFFVHIVLNCCLNVSRRNRKIGRWLFFSSWLKCVLCWSKMKFEALVPKTLRWVNTLLRENRWDCVIHEQMRRRLNGGSCGRCHPDPRRRWSGCRGGTLRSDLRCDRGSCCFVCAASRRKQTLISRRSPATRSERFYFFSFNNFNVTPAAAVLVGHKHVASVCRRLSILIP